VNAEPILELTGVAVVRNGRRLLDGVDWTVREGERWTVLGANGAGKTTLLQVAATLVAPDEGDVRVLGEPLAELDPEEARSRIGLSSSAVADLIPPAERVLDVVASAALGRLGSDGSGPADPVDEQRAARTLVTVGCRGLQGRPYGSLSEGERKRVQIARALMADPELLLLDEPSAGLDLGGREALLRRLTRLAADESGPASVLVTHHVEEVPVGTTHALLLRGGAVVSAGPLPEVMTRRSLSACFGIPLVVEERDGRYTARALA
jgi:iron complex transport system ATP-binding protein